MNITSKKEMTEEDIKFQFITPAILNKWDKSRIKMEAKITDGQIDIRGNMACRKRPKKADYLLYLNDSKPIAVVEAKDNNHSISYGMQQAITYAQMLDIPFAYSSNGDGFVEHDFLTGKEKNLSLDDFPSEDELISRFKGEIHNGDGLSPNETKILNQPYYTSQNTYPPRYYQRNAINRTVEAIARGKKRLLLVMATGTGKTYTAFQIVYRLLQSGLKRKILYLADRNILVDQSIHQDFSPLKKVIHKINFAKDDKRTITSHEVYFSLYQQMVGDNSEEHYSELFDPNFFDLVIVDECHRGSAKEESRWRKILDYFSNATQIGMTATPKETKYTSNINYFGEPVYEYSLKKGIEDGFLAPFKVINIVTNISDGWRPRAGQKDYYGNEIEDRIYNNSDYDYNIIIDDRTNEVAKQITEYLKATDRMQKTIVFCPTEEAADRMRTKLINHNSDMVKKNPDYIVRITGSDDYGKRKLKYFISTSEKYPVVVTTSDLLSTGVDCKMTKLIVIDKNINSMTQFKQIIGRGTRIREKEGKLNFTVMDFRGVSRLFADPDWDGPVEQVNGFNPNATGTKRNKESSDTQIDDTPYPIDTPPTPLIDKDGCQVIVTQKTVSFYDKDGTLLRQENIVDYTRENILGTYSSLANFIRKWSTENKKEAISKELQERGINLEQLKSDQNMTSVDDFDFIIHIAFDQKPLTRKERAKNVKKRDFLHKYSGVAREVLEALLEKYENEGIEEIESTEVLRLDPFRKYGKPAKIAAAFGGSQKYQDAIKELEEEIYRIG